jgi:hypothetical protein
MTRFSELRIALRSLPVGGGKKAARSFVLFVLICTPAFAPKDTGAIAGVVKDPTGAALAGVGHLALQAFPHQRD